MDVELTRLRSCCRTLQVVAPLVGLECACPRCVAYAMHLAAGSGDADSEVVAPQEEGAAGQGHDGGGNPAAPPLQFLCPDRIAQALMRAAALLAAPGSILERAELRSTAGRSVGSSRAIRESANQRASRTVAAAGHLDLQASCNLKSCTLMT